MVVVAYLRKFDEGKGERKRESIVSIEWIVLLIGVEFAQPKDNRSLLPYLKHKDKQIICQMSLLHLYIYHI